MKKLFAGVFAALGLLSFASMSDGCGRSLGSVSNTLAWAARSLNSNDYDDFRRGSTGHYRQVVDRETFDDLREQFAGATFGDFTQECTERRHMGWVNTGTPGSISGRLGLREVNAQCADFARTECSIEVPIEKNGEMGIVFVEMVCDYERVGDRSMPCPGANYSFHPECLVDEIDIDLE